MSEEAKLQELEIRISKLETQTEDFVSIRRSVLQLAFIGTMAGLIVALLKLIGVVS
ncbi:MAG: hypothetical protein V1822_00170 [Candidatus Micrarchaeota archaeon]